jgi:hypothetical protein
MADADQSLGVRKRWLLVALGAMIALMSGRALAGERPRIAVAIERAGELSLPREFGEGAAGRSLAQGVREACLEAGTLQPRTRRAECAVLRDVPDAQICVDETAEQALTLEIRCDGAGVTAEAVDLSRSGCAAGDCFAVEARHAGATDLLVVHATWKDGLALTGTLTNLATGRARTVAAQELEPTYNPEWPRSGPQVLALLKWFSRRLTLDVLKDPGRAAAPGPSAGAHDPVLVTPATPVQPPSLHSHRWIGWSLVAAGVVAGAAAGIVWSKDKDLTGCAAVAGDTDPCREVHRTIVPAAVIGAGALAALVGGSIVLISGRSNSDAKLAVSVQPSAIGLGGRF